METIFKEGMTVYDQVFFGKTPLKITEVRADNVLKVLYGEVNYFYTGDGRFIGDDITSNRWRPLSQTPTLSTSSYTLEGFEQKKSLLTFEEVWEEAESIYEPKSEYDKEKYKGYPSQELADASEALRRLLFLRDYYNDGWQPDWRGNDYKFCIVNYCGEMVIDDKVISACRVMTFKTKEIAKKFLEEQRELLEIAKPLL